MTEVYARMLSDDDDDSSAKCRERRRRRIEMRRLSAISSAGSPPPPGPAPATQNQTRTECFNVKRIRMAAETGDSSGLVRTASGSSGDDVEVLSMGTMVADPVVGSMSVAGRSRDMEDAITVRTRLCSPEMNHRRPVHFFGVYDGHGGPHVAALCRQRMHVFLEEELMMPRMEYTQRSDSGEEEILMWRRVMKRSFERMDELALHTCACGSVGYQCGCHPMEVALGGSTAVVAVLTQEHIVVANCGDSRAVLCRGGRAVPLSVDHKPDRPDELARIKAAGGRVIPSKGARVEGILAMSRAIGDKYLKPVVISDPEISFTKRGPEDECLILASDGLWDVLSSDLACEVARECLQEGNPPPAAVNAGSQIEDDGAGALYPSRSVLAAALLTRLALGRRSLDNISVIVVDLKRS